MAFVACSVKVIGCRRFGRGSCGVCAVAVAVAGECVCTKGVAVVGSETLDTECTSLRKASLNSATCFRSGIGIGQVWRGRAACGRCGSRVSVRVTSDSERARCGSGSPGMRVFYCKGDSTRRRTNAKSDAI